RLDVLVQGTLDPGEAEPGARAVRILRHQLLSEGELPCQVVVETLARHLDLQPLGLRSARGVLFGKREVALELVERVGGKRDVQVREGEARVGRDGLLEVRIRVDESGEVELPLALEEMVPRDARGR